MEVGASSPVSLPALSGTALSLATGVPNSNPVVKHSLQIWAQFRRNFGLQSFSFQSPTEHLFAPSMADDAFQIGHRKVLTCIDDLLIDNIFASLSQSAEIFDITSTHHFRISQIRRYIQCLCSGMRHHCHAEVQVLLHHALSSL